MLLEGRGSQEIAIFCHVSAVRFLPAAVYFHGVFRCSIQRWKPVFAILGSLQMLSAIFLISLVAAREVWKWFSVISLVGVLAALLLRRKNGRLDAKRPLSAG